MHLLNIPPPLEDIHNGILHGHSLKANKAKAMLELRIEITAAYQEHETDRLLFLMHSFYKSSRGVSNIGPRLTAKLEMQCNDEPSVISCLSE